MHFFYTPSLVILFSFITAPIEITNKQNSTNKSKHSGACTGGGGGTSIGGRTILLCWEKTRKREKLMKSVSKSLLSEFYSHTIKRGKGRFRFKTQQNTGPFLLVIEVGDVRRYPYPVSDP